MSFHIIFPAFTIGLASWLVVIEALWLKTQKPIYQALFRLWVKVFSVAFGMGVVSGIVMSYQFGTNWSGFSTHLGSVLGPLLGYEVLTAFFLESSFLGVMLFGWGRVSARMHFFSTCAVALGTLISGFWILAANSWMHTPAGYIIDVQKNILPKDWWSIIFNPSFPYRFLHMVTGAYLTTAFAVSGVAAWYLRQKKHLTSAKIMLSMGMGMALIVAPLQAILGDLHRINTLKYQPAKVAAMEGAWNTERGAPLRIFAWPNSSLEQNKFSLELPKLGSLILTHQIDGEVKGLKEWPISERPPMLTVFLSFRVMVGLGLLMILTGFISLFLTLKKRLFNTPWFQNWCIAMSPAGFIAILAGWFVAEIGRQPYIVYGLLRTRDIAAPLQGEQVLISLIMLVLVYVLVFGTGIFYILKLLKKGPYQVAQAESYGEHGLQYPGPYNKDGPHA